MHYRRNGRFFISVVVTLVTATVTNSMKFVSFIPNPNSNLSLILTRICAAEMAVRYATLSACRKVHP